MSDDITTCAASEPFALRVIGDDMAPEFVDGHVIVIDPGGKLNSGSYVVARHQGDVFFRRLQIEGRQLTLHAEKPGLAIITLENGITDIVGVVSQRSGRRRAEHKRYDV